MTTPVLFYILEKMNKEKKEKKKVIIVAPRTSGKTEHLLKKYPSVYPIKHIYKTLNLFNY